MKKLGHYDIPRAYEDEDKWFKFFTKVQLLIIGAGVLICIGLVMLFSMVGLTMIGVVMSVVVMMGAVVLAFVKVPMDRYLLGGGNTIRQTLGRVIRKRLSKNRVIYVKGYDRTMEGED